MKKFLHILLYSALPMLLFSGCIKEPFPGDSLVLDQDGDSVTINGSIALPATDDDLWASTKALAEEPGIKKLYVAVFDDADMLYQIVEARPGTNDQPSDDFVHKGAGTNYLTDFHVTLTKVNQGVRYVEFIAVGKEMPELLRANLMDESSLASTMVASEGTDAYFARKRYVLINENTDMKNIPMIRNYAKVNLDVSDLSCGVTGANVTITGFKVFNVPTNGMIAPFNANAPTTAEVDRVRPNESGTGTITEHITISNPDCFARFQDLPHVKAGTDQGAYKNMVTGFTYVDEDDHDVDVPKYTGYMSNSVTFNDFYSEYIAVGDATFSKLVENGGKFIAPNGADYLYECTYRAGAQNPYIILKAEWTEGGTTSTCYYKADFVYKDNGLNTYYHILRNFQYTLKIGLISAKGAPTIYEAANGIAMNNFQASTQAQSLTNISDGTSRLYISATDRLVTTGRIDTLYLRNKVLVNGNWEWDTHTEGDIRNGINVASGYPSGTPGYKKGEVVGRDDDLISYCTFDGVVAAGAPDAAQWLGWERVIVTMPTPYNLRKGMVWKQAVTFFNEAGLSRSCMITRRQPFELRIDVQDYVAPNKGQSCRVDISIPAGLTEARFPIEFYIEQEENTLYPDPSEEPPLPVATGKSIIPGRSGNNYYYTRIVDWPEYKAASESIAGIKTFSSYFKSLVEQSATTIWVMPREADGYFTVMDEVTDEYINCDSFVNSVKDASISFEKSSLTVKVGGEGVNVATATSGGVITYTSSAPGVATVDASGKVTGVAVGEATISATCAATDAYHAVTTPVTYTVTVIAADKLLPELEIRWKREPIYFFTTTSPRAKVYAIAFTKSTATPSITYGTSDSSVAVIEEENGEYYVRPVGEGSVTITATATVEPTGDYAGETQIITYNSVVSSAYAPSGTVFHQETFLERGTSDHTSPQYTIIQSDYTREFEVTTPEYGSHGQNQIWHLHTDGDYGAYATGWIKYVIWDPAAEEGHGKYVMARWNTTTNQYAVLAADDLTDETKPYFNAMDTNKDKTLVLKPDLVSAGWVLQPGTIGDDGAWATVESWLTSREIDLTASKSAKLTFSHAAEYHRYPQQMMEFCHVMIAVEGDYNDKTKWVDISPPASQYPYPDYKYVPAAIDLTPYAGKKVKIAFKYHSVSGNVGCSWEIKNVLITEN